MWTHRRLWRHPRTDAYDQLVYARGVRGFGALMIPVGVLIPLFSLKDDLTLGENLIAPTIRLVGTAIIGWPLALWAGYWWGRWMARFSGVERNNRPHN